MHGRFERRATAAVIVLTIGLAVGVVSTVFTAFDAILLRDLPLRDADRLVRIAAITPRGETRELIARGDFEALRHLSGPVSVAAFLPARGVVRDAATNRIHVLGIERVSDNFFDVAGVRLLRGAPPREREAVVSDRFASLQTVVIDGVTYSVSGVAAFRGMNFAAPADVWIAEAPARHVRVIGRLAGGATPADAERVLTNALPDRRTTASIRAGAERAMLISPESPRAVNIAIIVAAVLATACILVAAANVVGVLFARLAVRRRELAIRYALGATHLRIARQLAGEILPLTIPAALLAHLFALAGSRIYTIFMPATTRPMIDFTPGPRVALFAFAMTLAATLFAAISAAIHVRKAGASHVPPALRGLVVVQLAFTVLVLIAAALLVQTARAYRAVDPGFEYERQLTVQFDDAIVPRVRELAERIRQIDGITHVAITRNTPLGRQTHAPITIGEETRDGHLSFIEGDFFGSTGIPLLHGRNLIRGDRAAVVVNEAMRASVGSLIIIDGRPFMVVGIVRDARFAALAERARPYAWLPWSADAAPSPRLQIRVARDRNAVARDVTAILANAGVPASVAPLANTVQADRWLAETASAVAGALGVLTLILAAIGLFGVISMIVTSRRRELAVRVALGATRANVGRLVAGASGRLLAAGIVLGFAAAIPAARALASLLFAVDAFDPVSWATVPLVIAVVVAVATVVPTLRAMRTDPAQLLQEI